MIRMISRVVTRGVIERTNVVGLTSLHDFFERLHEGGFGEGGGTEDALDGGDGAKVESLDTLVSRQIVTET